MGNFNGAKPVKTERDNEFKITLVDGASGESATAKLSVITTGDSLSSKYGVLVFGKDGSGNAIEIPIGASGVKVEATDLDIRALDYNSDSVTAYQGGAPWSVSATDLDIRDLAFATDKVDVSGSSVSITGSVTVEATDLDIRDLSHTQDSVKIGDGTEFMAVNPDGSINANSVISGKVCTYNTTATVGVGSETLHFHVVASGKTFSGKNLLVGARGAVEVRFGISTDGLALSTVKGVYFQDPKENIDHSIECLELLGDGTKAICVAITNLDGASSDVYSTIQGSEV